MISDETSNDMFFSCSQSTKSIMEDLKNQNLIESINKSLKALPYKIKFNHNHNIKHFMVKLQSTNQFTLPAYNIYGKIPTEFKQYLNKYADQYMQYLLIDNQKKQETLSFEKDDDEYSGIYVNQDYLVFFIFSNQISIPEINTNLSYIVSQIESQSQQIFITKFV